MIAALAAAALGFSVPAASAQSSVQAWDQNGMTFTTGSHITAGEVLTYKGLPHTVTQASCGAGMCVFLITPVLPSSLNGTEVTFGA